MPAQPPSFAQGQEESFSSKSDPLPSGSLSGNPGGLGLSLAQVSSSEELSHQLKKHAQADPLIGQQVGNFRILERIGKGGFGAVYKAEQIFLQQSYAIKMLRMDQLSDEEVIERFRREAQALAQLRHDNIVQLSDFGMLPEFGFYLVMEHLEGQNLQQRLKHGEPFTLERIKNLIKQMCEVLSFVHSKGIVHRDLKPGNIFLLEGGIHGEHVKLIDFGIAALSTNSDITHTGTYLGTAKYVSPEQAQGRRELDARSDLYSLGVILYRILTGQVPFINDNMMNIIYHQINTPAPSLSECVPEQQWAPELEGFLASALAKSPNERPANAQEFWIACEKALDAQSQIDQHPNPPPNNSTLTDMPTGRILSALGQQVSTLISEEDSAHGSWSSSVRGAYESSLSSGDSFSSSGLSLEQLGQEETSISYHPVPLATPLWKRPIFLISMLMIFLLTIGTVLMFRSDKPNQGIEIKAPPTKFTLNTHPPKAKAFRVFRNGTQAYLGVTPISITGNPGDIFQIRLERSGYKIRLFQGEFGKQNEEKSTSLIRKPTMLFAPVIVRRPQAPKARARIKPKRRKRWRKRKRRKRRTKVVKPGFKTGVTPFKVDPFK